MTIITDNPRLNQTIVAINRQDQAADAFIHGVLEEIAYRRADTDFAIDLDQLNTATAAGTGDRFIDGFVAGAPQLIEGLDSLNLTAIEQSEIDIANGLNSVFDFDGGVGEFRVDADPDTGVYHIWNQAGFSAFVVFDSLEQEFIITFRGTDVSQINDESPARYLNSIRDQAGINVLTEFRPDDPNNATDLRIGSEFQHQDEGDWFSNVLLGDGSFERNDGSFIETQFDYALALTLFVRDNFAEGDINNVTLAGQSLGGGLASLAGVVTGAEIYAFGPAPFYSSLQVLADRFGVNVEVYENHLETHAFASTVEGEFTTNTDPSSGLQNIVHFGFGRNDLFTAEQYQTGTSIGTFQLNDDLTDIATNSFNDSVGFFEGQGFFGEVEFEIVQSFVRESLARHSPALHALLLSGEALLPEIDGLDVLFQESNYLQFAFFNTPGLAGTLLENKEGETDIDGTQDPGQSLGTQRDGFGQITESAVSVEPIYRLLLSSVLDQAGSAVNVAGNPSFYEYFSNFFNLTTQTASILNPGNDTNPTDKNLHSAVIKIALQIIRDAVGDGESYSDFRDQLNANLGIDALGLTAAFAGDFESLGYITLDIEAITAENNIIFQELLFDGRFTILADREEEAYGISDLGQAIFDRLVAEGVSEGDAEDITRINVDSAFLIPDFIDYTEFVQEYDFSFLIVQTDTNRNINIDLSTSVSQDADGAVIFLDNSEDTSASVNGTAQRDFIFGDDSADTINGFGGDDNIFSSEGDDTIHVTELGSSGIIDGGEGGEVLGDTLIIGSTITNADNFNNNFNALTDSGTITYSCLLYTSPSPRDRG